MSAEIFNNLSVYKKRLFHLKNKLRNELYDIELETGEIIGTIIENKEDWTREIVTNIYKNIAKEGITI